MTAEFLLQLLTAFACAAGVYAAIKSDLTRAIIIAERAEEQADSAQSRISEHIDTHHTTHRRTAS